MRLKAIMEQKSIKQNELSKILNISTTSLNNYCNGKTEPNIETLKKIADYFSVSLDYLCDHKFNSKIGYIPEDRIDLIKVITNLTDRDFSQVSNYVKGYVDGKTSSNDAMIK